MFTIENVIFEKDDSRLTFVSLDGQQLKMELEGDCCSISYFDNDSKLEARDLMGHTIQDVQVNNVGREELDYGDRKLYQLVIRTDKASISLAWRNDSNGYYSGWVNLYLDGEKLYYPYFKALGIKKA